MMKHLTLVLAGLIFAANMASAQTLLQRLQTLESKVKTSASGLPDFAPNLYQKAQQSILDLRANYDKTGKLTEESMRLSKGALDNFEYVAPRVKSLMSKTQQLRLSASHNNFARSYNPKLFLKAEKEYWAAIAFGEKQKFDKLKTPAKKAEDAYKALLKAAQRSLKLQIGPQLSRYQKAVNDDLLALNGNVNDPDVAGQADGVLARVNLSNFGIGIDYSNIFTEPPYFPPPPQAGPTPPVAVGIVNRGDNFIEIDWHDRSDNETGNRVLRTTDLLNWETISERGVLEKFSHQEYTDQNLQAATRYCYMIETYNAEGARRSQFRCTHTRDSTNIPVWRVQLNVKVANVEHAGSDSEIRVSLDGLGGNSTYLDYGRDDFERNSNFTYDLNLNNISELSDIVGIMISSFGDDRMLVQELNLLVNNGDTLFHRFFGTSRETALTLGGYQVQHDELRASPHWNAFLQASEVDQFQNVPPVKPSENGQFQVEIEHAQIVSRIESLVGHMIHAEPEIKGKMQWGQLSGAAVEVTRASENTYHVDLDLEVPINNWPNPALDVDFDLGLTKECSNDSTMVLNIVSRNFTSNADYALWKDIVSIGTTAITSELINWYTGNCTAPPQIEQEIEFNLPASIGCENLDVLITDDGNLAICCFSLFSN